MENVLTQSASFTEQISASFAETVLAEASELGAAHAVSHLRAALSLQASAAETGKSEALNELLNGVGTAPGATTILSVPQTSAGGEEALVQDMQTLDGYISVLTALVMYNKHPAMYDLSNGAEAAQFVIDLADARNFVVTGGAVKAIAMYLSMGEASSQQISKSTTSAELHVDFLITMFGSFGLPAAVLTELDGILTEVADSLKNLKLSFSAESQTLNHFLTFTRLVPIEGTSPPLKQVEVHFIYIELDQSSWQASLGKSSVNHFALDMTITKTSATMNAGLVSANTSNIVNSLIGLTKDDPKTISEMTKVKTVKS
jgi:hypothetical protein